MKAREWLGKFYSMHIRCHVRSPLKGNEKQIHKECVHGNYFYSRISVLVTEI